MKTAKMADAQDVELLAQKKEDGRKKRSAKAHHKAASKSLKGKSKQNQPDKVIERNGANNGCINLPVPQV